MKFGSILSPELRGKHGKRAVRPRVGDTVKIVRGEYKDIEGKVTRVFPSLGVVNVDGVTKEKQKGGTSPVPIRSSNIIVTSVVLDDKLRKAKMEARE